MTSTQDLKNFCLSEMGITQWQRRSLTNDIAKHSVQWDYIIFVSQQELENNHKLNAEKSALLDRLLQALRWSKDKTKIEFVGGGEPNVQQKMRQIINAYNPNKCLAFGVDVQATSTSLASLPSLTKLLTEPLAKKQAWQLMQPFIHV